MIVFGSSFVHFLWMNVRLPHEAGLKLLSVPMAYKNIRDIMTAQNDLVTVQGEFMS